MLSVVLPAYNEEKNIKPLLEEALSFLGALPLEFEVLVVNDGSSDRTYEVALSYQQKHSNVRVISHSKNRGYGAALRSGFAHARGDLIFFMDSDRQFDIRDIQPFLKEIPRYDFLIGYRKKRRDPFMRRLNALFFNQTMRLLLGIRVKDINCAFKLFHSNVIKSLPLSSSGALINAEILALLKKKGHTFRELPVNHLPRQAGKPTGGNPIVVLKALCGLFSLWWSIRKQDDH